jgi:hypothetical protein
VALAREEERENTWPGGTLKVSRRSDTPRPAWLARQEEDEEALNEGDCEFDASSVSIVSEK